MKIGFKIWWLNSVFRLLNEALGTLCESGTNVAVLRNGFIFVYVLWASAWLYVLHSEVQDNIWFKWKGLISQYHQLHLRTSNIIYCFA